MKNIKQIWIISLYVFFGILRDIEASDLQLWLQANTNFLLQPCWSLQMQYEARFRNDASKAYLYFIELNLARDLACGWQIVPGYRQVFRREEKNKWKLDAIPHVSIIKYLDLCGYELASRSRGEYRSRDNIWIFRQRILCDFLKQFTPMHFRFSSFGEIFFRSREGFSQLRLFAGLKNDLLRVGYMYRRVLSQMRWENENIVFLSYWWNF